MCLLVFVHMPQHAYGVSEDNVRSLFSLSMVWILRIKLTFVRLGSRPLYPLIKQMKCSWLVRCSQSPLMLVLRKNKSGVVVHIWDPRLEQLSLENHEFEASLGYLARACCSVMVAWSGVSQEGDGGERDTQ